MDQKLTVYSNTTLVGYLLPNDGLRNAKVNTELNTISELTFDFPYDSPKWDLLEDPLLRIRVDGREFCPLNSVESTRNGPLFGKVALSETQCLMGRDYPTVGTTPLAVTILASDPGEGGQDSGSAGSALYRLLDSVGSVWTVGTVDVTGTHDLETEKLTLLENINEVQKIWGGWLVFDSINKTVSLRSDTFWQNDTGFELRYRKNQKTLTKIADKTNIVTRIYPLGEKDLTIATVNSGAIHLDNTSYTSEIRAGIWRREDIDDPQELKDAATEYLAKVCRPRVQYKGSALDLRTLTDFSHETFSLGDIVTIQDEDLADAVKVRLIGYSYDVIQPWKCDLKIGEPLVADPQKELSASLKAADFVQNVLYASKGVQRLSQGAINTFTTLINSANGKVLWSDDTLTFIGIDGAGVETGKRMKLTPGGLGISHDSGSTYVTAITGDGILADKIIVSDLYALTSDDTYSKMNGSGFHVYDASDVERVMMGKWVVGSTPHYGMKVYNNKGNVLLDDTGILQTWQDHLVDNVDETHGLTLNLYLPATTLAIVNARLRLKLAAFRAYEKGAEVGGDHRHQMLKYEADSTETKTKRVFSTVKSDGSFGAYLFIESPGGTDTQLYTKGTSGTHTHPLDFGIYEDTTATGVTVKINGTDRTSALGGPFSTDKDDLNIASYLVAGQLNTIVLGSTRLGRIDATVFLQAKMSSS